MEKIRLVLAVFFLSLLFPFPGTVSADTLAEVVEGAKREGRLRVYSSMQRRTAAEIMKVFRQKYPFIKDVDHFRFTGLEESERVLAELKVGRFDMDVLLVRTELWDRHKEFLAGPLDWKGLGIAQGMVGKGGFETIWAGSGLKGIIYNETMMPPDHVPTQWEDCADPRWKENVIVYARPIFMMQLMPAWGEEKVLDFARKLAANKPIWVSSQTTATQRVAAGEVPLFCGGDDVRWFRLHKRGAPIKLASPEPVATSEGRGLSLLKAAKNPNAGKLFMAYMASDETQLLLDKLEGRGHISVEGTLANKMAKGKKLSMFTDEWGLRAPELSKKVIEAWGFPVAQ